MMENLLRILLAIPRGIQTACYGLFALNIGMEFVEKSKMPLAYT